MAGAITLTEVDFEQIKLNLIDYLKSTKQFTDYDFSGSNLQVRAWPIHSCTIFNAQLQAVREAAIAAGVASLMFFAGSYCAIGR